MAGTNRTLKTEIGPVKPGPIIVLVRPQIAENIGMVARAMMNCALYDLRLVCPREDPLSDKGIRASSGAEEILHTARTFTTTEEAISDLNRVFCATARRRDMTKVIMTPRAATQTMRQFSASGDRIGVLFGAERAGLDNDDVALSDVVIEVPLNPAYASLNLAQAVLLVGYEWFQSGVDVPEAELVTNASRPANREELLNFFQHLERELDASGFLRNIDKRPGMVRNIRNLFERAGLTEQEIRTLHGIVKELRHGRVS